MNQFKDRKILIMGLGLSPKGSGVSATKFFVACGAKVLVTDLRDKKDLRPSLRLLRGLDVEFILGKHRESDFKKADLIIKNPGVRWNSPYLQIAKKNGVPIETDVGLFWKLCPAPVIAITGTRGKSTSTALTYKMLKRKYENVKRPGLPGRPGLDTNVFMGGNIQLSPLTFIDKVKPDSKVVLELSSWMLEDILYVPYELKKNYEIAKNFMIKPRIAVLTNIMPDHLDTYKTFDDYIKAKALIFKNQDSKDFAILNYDDRRVKNLADKINAQKIWFSEKEPPHSPPISAKRKQGELEGVFVKKEDIIWKFQGKKEKVASLGDVVLLGKHNIKNILVAIAIAKIEGISNRAIQKVLKTFKGLPNRLEFIREVKGIKFYNDTTSTMPEATMCALRALSQPIMSLPDLIGQSRKGQIDSPIKSGNDRIINKNIILIAGGSDKKLQYRKLAREIKKYCKAVVLFEGPVSKKILKQLLITNYQLPVIKNVTSMKEAIQESRKLVETGDVVLLSPAAASFGLFKNEFDRGEQFKKIVKKL